MNIYYIKQDNTVWGCGDPMCCGEYQEEIEESFVKCEHDNVDAEHLHSCASGGPVLEWRKATISEYLAFYSGTDYGFSDGWSDGLKYGTEQKQARIIKLLETNCGCGIWRDHLLGCPHEVAIALIKGETE